MLGVVLSFDPARPKPHRHEFFFVLIFLTFHSKPIYLFIVILKNFFETNVFSLKFYSKGIGYLIQGS